VNDMSLFEFDEITMPDLDVSRCAARRINYETAARVARDYHYARRVPSIVASFGMYVDDVLAGVITYGIPPNRNALSFCGEEYIEAALELNRLFVFDWAGKNSESWLIGQSFSLLEAYYPEYYLLISYADPAHDHNGIVYQATNWIYTGTGSSGKSDVVLNGKTISEKQLFNLYGTHKRDVIAGMGGVTEDIIAVGKHRYVYFLGDKRKRKLMKSKLKWAVLPYPKSEVCKIAPKA
jgi:hypothetical protein